MKFKILSCFFICLLWSNHIKGKTIVDTSIWSTATHIYQINTHIHGIIQVETLKPLPNLQGLETVNCVSIQLPADIISIQDVVVYSGKTSILFILTTNGQLLGIDMTTQRTKFIINLADYFGKAVNFTGSLAIARGENDYLVAAVNAAFSGIMVLDGLQYGHQFGSNITNSIKLMLAPVEVVTIVTSGKLIANISSKKIFSGVKTRDGSAVWEFDMDCAKSQKLHKLGVNTIKDIVLLAIQNPQNLDAFAIYDNKYLSFQPYLDIAPDLQLSKTKIIGENIQDIIIGPAIIAPGLSWYIVNNATTGNYLTSNNFANRINLPVDTKVFLRHGELIFASIAEEKLFSINSRSGKPLELSILRTWQQQLKVAAIGNSVDFLFWEPTQQQHVLLSIRDRQIYVKHFALYFDKPKILSWRRENLI